MGKKLTNKVVESWDGEGQRYERGLRAGELVEHPVLWDTEIKGFGVRYAVKGKTLTYILQFRIKGARNERTITIGRHNDPWRIDQARAEALRLKTQMVGGLDPVIEAQRKQAEAEAQAVVDKAHGDTLRNVMQHYLENKQTKYGPLRPKTKHSIKDVIERNLSTWLDVPMVNTVTREACLTRFAEISDRGRFATANQTFVYLRALCNHARNLHAEEDGTPTIFAANPVTLMIRVRKFNYLKPSKDRIAKDRIGHVWNALRERAANGATDVVRAAADWLSFTLLTGTRLTESGALLKEHVDLTAKTVRLPGEVENVPNFSGSKNHHELVLPLSTPLVELLAQRITAPILDTAAARRRHRERCESYCFPGFGVKRPYLYDPRATLRLISKVAGTKITTHDLRRSFEDILRYAKVDPDERRLILNHLGGDVHSVSYSNSDDPETLRHAMQAAADWVIEQSRIAAAPNVVQFHAKQA